MLDKYLHFAADSGDGANVVALISPAHKIDVNYLCDGQTALSKIVAGMCDAHFESSLDAIRKLLESGADVNIPDKFNVPPILRLLRASNLSVRFQRRAVELLLLEQKPVVVDIDSHCNGEARRLLERQYPDILQKASRFDEQYSTTKCHMMCLDSEENNDTAVQQSNPMTELTLQGSLDSTLDGINSIPDFRNDISKAARFGHFNYLKELLKKCPINDLSEFASEALIFAGYETNNHKTCVHMLLSVRNIDVNRISKYRKV